MRTSQLKAASNIPLQNDEYYYLARIGVGTPRQYLNVQIDTGSSDLWVMASSNRFCYLSEEHPDYINCTNSIFNPTRSRSFNNTETKFNIHYADGTYASGHMVKDIVRLGQLSLKHTYFALAETANSDTIVMGIGFPGDEALDKKYRNIPVLLKERGLTKSTSYSLWLNDLKASRGALLFGGVDHAKYTGKLNIVPIVAKDTMTVMLNGISLGDRITPMKEYVKSNIPVILDSGTSIVYLPRPAVRAVGKALGMKYDSQQQMYSGPYPNHLDGALRFNFSGAAIDVPLDMVLQKSDDDSSKYNLLIMESSDDPILGDVFLRAAYAVYDLDHHEIGLAQAQYHQKKSDVEEIDQGIPGVKAPYYSTYKKSRKLAIFDHGRAFKQKALCTRGSVGKFAVESPDYLRSEDTDEEADDDEDTPEDSSGASSDESADDNDSYDDDDSGDSEPYLDDIDQTGSSTDDEGGEEESPDFNAGQSSSFTAYSSVTTEPLQPWNESVSTSESLARATSPSHGEQSEVESTTTIWLTTTIVEPTSIHFITETADPTGFWNSSTTETPNYPNSTFSPSALENSSVIGVSLFTEIQTLTSASVSSFSLSNITTLLASNNTVTAMPTTATGIYTNASSSIQINITAVAPDTESVAQSLSGFSTESPTLTIAQPKTVKPYLLPGNATVSAYPNF